MCDVVDRLGGWLSQLHMETKIKEGLTKEQLSSLSQLADACHSLIDHIDKLKTMIASIASGQRVVVAGESQSDTMATLRACQILKSCIDYMRPPKTESEGLFKALNKISQVSKGPSGFELIAFPMMRKQVIRIFLYLHVLVWCVSIFLCKLYCVTILPPLYELFVAFTYLSR